MKSVDMRGHLAEDPRGLKWRLARLTRATIGRWLCAAYRLRFVGWENVPAGGAILAGNHQSYLDPAILWCATVRPTHFVAKEELWGKAWIGYLLDHFWAIPVKRGAADREMIATASNLLAHGELLGMFPEGTRNRDAASDELGEAHGGVAFLAIRAGVPVVPVGIAGTDLALPAGASRPKLVPVTMVLGEPVSPDDFEGTRKEKVAAMTAEIMRRIAEVRALAREA